MWRQRLSCSYNHQGCILTIHQFYDSIYQIKATEGIQVLVPVKYVSELKSLPEEILSAREAVSEVSNWNTLPFGGLLSHFDLLQGSLRTDSFHRL